MLRPGFGTTLAAAAAPARQGGVLRLATIWPNISDTLDPARFDARMEILLGFQLFNTLVRISPKLQPVPELAEFWDAGLNATEWTFRLHRNVLFHNGKTLTAEDVIYSLARHLRTEPRSLARALLSDVTEFKALDERTMRIRLSRPNADFPLLLADYHMGIVPAGFANFHKPVGTGPFRFESLEAGMRATTVRNNNYWKTGLPYLDAIETFPIPNRLAQFNALLYGNADLVDDLDPVLITREGGYVMADVTVTPSGSHGLFAMMCDRPPFNDPDARLAMKHLIDRDAFVREVYRGHGRIANDHPVSPLDPYHCRDLPQRAYDPDRALHHLKRAGQEGLSIALYTSEAAFTNAVKGALVLARGAAKAGVKIDIRREPAETYASRVRCRQPFFMGGWYMGATPDLLFRIAYSSDATWGETMWRNERFDRLVQEARSMLDARRRLELYCECQRLLYEDGPVVIPAFNHNVEGVARRVKGLIPHPLNNAAGWSLFETVWLDD